MKTNIKKISIGLSVLVLVFLGVSLLVSQKTDAYTDTYLTTYTTYYTYYTTENRWVPCTWNITNNIYQCSDGSVWQSPGDCDRIGKPPASYYGWNAFNSCTGQYICSNNGVPDPGGYWQSYQQAHTGSQTNYLCWYACGASEWSSCLSHSQSPISGIQYCSTSGTSCSSTLGPRFCNSAPNVSITSYPDQPIKSFEEGTFTGLATDPDGDSIVEYKWFINGTLIAGSNATTFSYRNWTPATTAEITFQAKDVYGAWSDASAPVNVIIRPNCEPDNPSAGEGGVVAQFCPGDKDNLVGISNIISKNVGGSVGCSDDGTMGTKCQYYYPPTDGIVGGAESKQFCDKPSEEDDLCSSGHPINIQLDDEEKYWTWTCEGYYGGKSSDGKAIKSCAWKEVNPE